jgi:hypothetical protein
MQNDSPKLEDLIDRTLRAQPPLRAPSGFETRVWHELARLAALPWWRRSFAYWPLAARALFVLASGVFIKLALTGADWMSDAAAAPVASVQAKARLASSLMETGAALAHAIPPQWLYVGVACGAVMYMLLFGLGATAYRTLYK